MPIRIHPSPIHPALKKNKHGKAKEGFPVQLQQ